MTPLHGIASRHDLPLPFELVLLGAAAVLAITFWIIFFAWREPRFAEPFGKPLPRLTRVIDSKAVKYSLRFAVAICWFLATIALLFGADRIDNPSVGLIYVCLWVGLVPTALLLGEIYRETNPIRLALGWRWLGKWKSGPSASRWPAAAALLGFLCFELVIPGGETLPVLRLGALSWLIWLVTGSALYRGWITRADPFECYAELASRLSPWQRISGQLTLVNPLRNLASWHPPVGIWLPAVVLLAGTAFDAFSSTAVWQRLIQTSGIPSWTWAGAGLGVSVLLVAIAYAFGASFLSDGDGIGETLNRFSPGLVPLVVGYCLAHYGTYLYLEGQRAIIRLNDPLGKGQNWFGFAEASPNTTLLAFPALVAWCQVFCIVVGHILGVVVTHDIALRSSSGRQLSRQLPLLLVMIGFTVGGLLLMFGG